jgi:transaldolase
MRDCVGSLAALKVRLFADGADLDGIRQMAAKPLVRGFTTNPTLMQKAGVRDYRAFARDVLSAVPDRPVSFEVFADDFEAMEDQALEVASWGPNVNVKIPITNTRGEFAGPLIRRLSAAGVFLNVTAVMTLGQVDAVLESLAGHTAAFISIFAGRIADTGRDPMPVMTTAVRRAAARPGTEIIWASPRELLNIFQADAAGVQVITVANDLLKKLDVVGRDLEQYSLDTVQMFYDDAGRAGFEIPRSVPTGAR